MTEINHPTHTESTAEENAFLERAILDLGIPPCPTILLRFMEEMRKDEPDYDYLTSLISADINISAGLIKTANSPFFGLRSKARSGGAALMILGLKATSVAVAGIVLRNTFPNIPNLERFWENTTRISLLAGWLAGRLNIRGLLAEDAYTFALFRDCGIPALLGRFPHYAQILDSANQERELSFTEVEEEGIPTHHAAAGNLLATSWYLPKAIALAILHHHDNTALSSHDARLPLLSRRLVAVAQLAEQIAQQQLGYPLTQEWQKLGPICLELLDLNAFQLESLYADAAHVITTLD
jgi:HD-like signal output (HDOD) protein